MRKTKDTFTPSAVLDGIYDILNESICVAANEDIYFDDIIWDIVRFLDENDEVTTFLWEDIRDDNEEGGMLFISWTEGRRLFHEHYKYRDANEDRNYQKRKKDVRDPEDIVATAIKKVRREMNGEIY